MRFISLLSLITVTAMSTAADSWVIYPGGSGPGQGKKVVLVSGDEEYRSEETLTQLGRILAVRHGFTCTVLYAIDPKDGTINPNIRDNIPGLEALKSADLMIIFTRYRDLPDAQMKYIVEYIEAGKPIIGLRTATHAFNIKQDKTYARYGANSKDWPGGFGKQVLGETWVAHHGAHGKEGTRGLVVKGEELHPVLRGIKSGDIFGASDVYTVNLPLAGGSVPMVLGQVTASLDPKSPAVAGKKNDPLMPVAWRRTYKPSSGKSARVFTTTMGAAEDFASAGLRRLLVNASYWAVGLEDRIPAMSEVEIVGEFTPSPFKTNGFKKGVKPEDLRLK